MLTQNTITLEQVASAEFIARMDPRYAEQLRAVLASLTPDTLVDDECGTGPLTMAALAKAHQDSVGPGERRMSKARAWGYAVSDLVFHGFSVEKAPPTPNAYVVIAFTKNGPENRGTYSTESEARAVYDGCEHGYLAAQIQLDLAAGAAGGQTTVWGAHK